MNLQKPLVGYEAPDFVAQAVFDQEFQTVTLSQFRVRGSSTHTVPLLLPVAAY